MPLFFIFYINLWLYNRCFWQHETLAQYQNKCLAPNHPFFFKFYFINACVLFIDIIIWFIPSLFTGFFSASLQISVINFNHFLFTCTGIFREVFQRCLLSNFLNIFSQVFSRVFLSAIFLNFDHRFFHRVFHRLIFHRVLNFEIFSKFRLCKIHRVFHRVFTCHRVFHIFFTAFSQVFIQQWRIVY